jgi:hypothetical protein
MAFLFNPDRTDVGSATKRKTGQDFFCHHHENNRDGSDAMPMILLHITRVHKGERIHHYEKKRILVYDGRYPSAWTNAIISFTCSSCFLVSFRSFWINRPILTICNR